MAEKLVIWLGRPGSARCAAHRPCTCCTPRPNAHPATYTHAHAQLHTHACTCYRRCRRCHCRRRCCGGGPRRIYEKMQVWFDIFLGVRPVLLFSEQACIAGTAAPTVPLTPCWTSPSSQVPDKNDFRDAGCLGGAFSYGGTR